MLMIEAIFFKITKVNLPLLFFSIFHKILLKIASAIKLLNNCEVSIHSFIINFLRSIL